MHVHADMDDGGYGDGSRCVECLGEGCGAVEVATHLLGRDDGDGVLWRDGGVVGPRVLFTLDAPAELHMGVVNTGGRLQKEREHGQLTFMVFERVCGVEGDEGAGSSSETAAALCLLL